MVKKELLIVVVRDLEELRASLSDFLKDAEDWHIVYVDKTERINPGNISTVERCYIILVEVTVKQ